MSEEVSGEANSSKSSPVSPFKLYYGIGGTLYFISLGVSLYYFQVTPFLAHCISMSIACFLLMAVDKSAAINNALRVPERVLYVLAALGGSAGILVGSNSFRHKTRKAHFHLVVLVILVLQVFGVGYFFGTG